MTPGIQDQRRYLETYKDLWEMCLYFMDVSRTSRNPGWSIRAATTVDTDRKKKKER